MMFFRKSKYLELQLLGIPANICFPLSRKGQFKSAFRVKCSQNSQMKVMLLTTKGLPVKGQNEIQKLKFIRLKKNKKSS